MIKFMNSFILNTIEEFKSIEGKSVLSWSGVEMAFRQKENQIEFTDISIDLLQFVGLTIHFTNGDLIHLTTYQNDDNWGLGVAKDSTLYPKDHVNSIFRWREITELPTGKIEKIETTLDSCGDITNLLITIHDKNITFSAGEIYEEWDGSFKIVYGDESILIKVP